jgi:hypothetical protein
MLSRMNMGYQAKESTNTKSKVKMRKRVNSKRSSNHLGEGAGILLLNVIILELWKESRKSTCYCVWEE